MWEWPSTRPGMSVVPGRSTTLALAASMPEAGPAASIRPERTRTAQPSCSASPSKTRAGLRTMMVAGSRMTCWDGAPIPVKARSRQMVSGRCAGIGLPRISCGGRGRSVGDEFIELDVGFGFELPVVLEDDDVAAAGSAAAHAPDVFACGGQQIAFLLDPRVAVFEHALGAVQRKIGR